MPYNSAPHKTDDWEDKTVNVEGITWHVIVLDPEPFAATKALMSETFGLAPEVEREGMVMFIMPNGTMLELNEPQAASADYGINDGLGSCAPAVFEKSLQKRGL